MTIDRDVVGLDPFEQAAQEMATSAHKARRRAVEAREAKSKVKIVQSEKDAPMKLSELEQKVADQSKQMRSYKAWKRAEFDAMLAGPNGNDWRILSTILRRLTIDDSEALIEHIKGARWLLDADLRTRQIALALIANRIINLRLENGLSPMDDSLPGEPLTAFEIIRAELKVLT
jgi:hypothetical protein